MKAEDQSFQVTILLVEIFFSRNQDQSNHDQGHDQDRDLYFVNSLICCFPTHLFCWLLGSPNFWLGYFPSFSVPSDKSQPYSAELKENIFCPQLDPGIPVREARLLVPPSLNKRLFSIQHVRELFVGIRL